ncbi:Shedu anti-phage system protein SduA domain-containing protein [Pinibacter aurantiacus]|uniref:DUF4263 domain-containing protein n=1 Tax=Pinibacter aurantiacus TaxID=2851599 RepID=A0A9E2S9V6_9BACT|nr:Shedu anti-phage system protein SduA domain-containing protein [Pinibacter aurantiacus]MBV4359106.1 DUF4263 domain-containing protein [Pinibacter aurantiacus]
MDTNWYDNHQKRVNLIKAEWERMLSQHLSERFYQTFLSKYVGIFWGNENCHLVISKLKLGSELETDFVSLTDGFSNGNVFELIEIKQPSARLFTEKGTMTADFNRAVQQIRDWKRWLVDNKAWVKAYLPTINTRVIFDSQLKFTIVIGRRTDNPYEIEKRNQIGKEIGAEIRSFDYLTDKVTKRIFYPRAWTEDDFPDFESQLANPFHKAITDARWKKFCKSTQVACSHFYSRHYCEVIKKRPTFDFE